MVIKFILIAFGVFFLWFLFSRKNSFLGSFFSEGSSFLYSFAFAVIRALFNGYIIYLLFVVYGNFDHISSARDVLTVVTSRPSQLGGWGVLGLIFGGLVAFFGLFHRPPEGDPTGAVEQKRKIVVESLTTDHQFSIWPFRKK